ncbi:hypothetical protein CCO03_11900 [Comamonas serinivorans]|uniref:NodB homology domain-containing protein n=1 Tax=Comamonas serinivorans TaxID=1082851 RepID=A0A1Y0EPB6_9BURK|nr:polysaccharide deacetylase family protein [Comamonas serinivorans]ARU05290.1 hypothetical protein CCO03_11900 [Comamonas serinivorans]
MITRWRLVLLAVLAGLVSTLLAWRQAEESRSTVDTGRLVLLLPSGEDSAAPWVQVWRDAASEQGLLLTPLPINLWARQVSYGRHPGAGVILPDTYHRRMGETAAAALVQYVKRGGHLMLVQDGGLRDEQGLYLQGPARLSQLAGVEYGNYSALGARMGDFLEVRGTPQVLESLLIPPGRYQPVAARHLAAASDAERDADDSEATQPAPSGSDVSPIAMPTAAQWSQAKLAQVSGYAATAARFPILRTGPARGTPLLTTPEGDVVAQQFSSGAGTTLFVNLPLTHLSQQTDGLFLHGFLKYFGRDLLGLPSLAPTPRNQGIFIVNWHNDDRAAIGYLSTLQAAGLFDHGHQSMHFTAGPDVERVGDGLGMDLPHNPEAQAMVRQLAAQGHAIGNHGGWRHNDFGKHADTETQAAYEPLLDQNNKAITAILGHQPIEYSAPQGNNPIWVYDWLQQHGNLAYYTTSNIGMAPTRLWMGNRRMGGGWAFPVMTNGTIASPEEAYFQRMPTADFSAWLQETARFVETERLMRLSYFHPIGVVLYYLQPVKDYIDRIQTCADAGHCRFMSMTEAARFMTRREQVSWQLATHGKQVTLEAHHPDSLRDLVWQIPRNRYTAVTLNAGDATVVPDAQHFTVTVRDGRDLSLTLTPTP